MGLTGASGMFQWTVWKCWSQIIRMTSGTTLLTQNQVHTRMWTVHLFVSVHNQTFLKN